MLKIIKNPDKKKYDELTKAIKNRDGYCCCIIQKNEDSRCMCKDFRDKVANGIAGPCVCGRFIAVEEESKNIDVIAKIKLEKDGILPVRKTDGAAAFDCYANEDAVIQSGERKLISLGFSVQVPDGYCLTVLPRSGNTRDGIDIGTGTIDSDYRGIVHACVINSRKSFMDFDEDGDFVDFNNFVVHKGDRICQVKFEKLPTVTLKVVDELDPTERGAGGFGHTGVR